MSTNISFDSFSNIINNKQKDSSQWYCSIDPATEEDLWKTPIASEADLDEAVAAANLAFRSWSKSSHDDRSQMLQRLASELEIHKDSLTTLLQRETGKPADFAHSEILMGIATVRGHANWRVPDKVLKDTDLVRIVTQHVPIGVVAGIVPWNYPFQLAILKIAPAVMTGCSIIIKPSPFTPYTALKIAEIASTIFPPGVIQGLGGTNDLGAWMTRHPDISKISFTGSIATGKAVMAAASTTLKRVNLELGGNDAAIITEDVDVEQTAQLVAAATFAHSGQICMATKRIYVHETIYDEFLSHLTAIVKTYKPGEGFCSPIQNKAQYQKVQSILDDCTQNGYQFALTGSSDSIPKAGYYISPAIIANPPDTSRIVQEEPFGPIVPVMSWSNEEEVISRVNDTLTGLGATVYCSDSERAWRISSSIESGSVWVNGGLKLDPEALFGAHKQSGIGGELGPVGMTYYTNTRTVTYWKEATKSKGSALFA